MKKKQKNSKQVPLLYIAQPTFQEGKHVMQNTFVIKPGRKKEKNEIVQQTDTSAELVGNWQEPPDEEDNYAVEPQIETYAAATEAKQLEEFVEESKLEEKEGQDSIAVLSVEAVEGQENEVALQLEETEEQENGAALQLEETEEQENGAALQLEETEEQEDTSAGEDVEQAKDEEERNWRGRPFREMSNDEKVQYLLNRPHYIPQVRCYIRTKMGSHIGYITAYEDGVVSVKSPRKLFDMLINIEDILLIQMIGQ